MKPMTSVFYGVIRLEAVRGGLNVPIEGHFTRFLGNFKPQNVVGHRVDPQKGTSLRHNACFESSCVKFHAWVTSVGESGKKIKREALYFTYFARRSLKADWHTFLSYVFVSWT